MIMDTLIWLPTAYLAGSVNFSILVLRFTGKGDPRERFSGNAGVTNVQRQAGTVWAGFVFLLDMARALAVSWIALWMLPIDHVPWTGLAFVVGNRYPCFHQFRGGKGVAAYLGFTIPMAPLASLASALLWLIVHKIVRLPFIASFVMVATLAAGTIIATGYGMIPALGAATTALFIFCNHRGNIESLCKQKKNL